MSNKWRNGTDIVEAIQFTGNFNEIEKFVGGDAEFRGGKLLVATKDGPLWANPNDYIVKNDYGRFSSINAGLFLFTFKEVNI